MSNRKLLLHNREQKILRDLHLFNSDIAEEHREEKFEKMSATPYVFYRGSNHIYWEDFYNDWRINFFGGRSETLTWINGDAHIYNYGAYANHHGDAVFCMDDFDDAMVADYQFDLWRMGVSIVLDCREHGVFDESAQREALMRFAKAYRDEMASHKDDDPNNEIHLTKKTAEGLLKKFLKKVQKKKSRMKMLEKWTEVVDGKRKFNLENPKVKKLNKETYDALKNAMEGYQATLTSDIKDDATRFEVKDIVARASAGTGSLGSARYYALVEGDTDGEDDDVILDVKEQGRPPLFDHMSPEEQEEFDRIFPNPAERHALAFQALAEHPDKYLGWMAFDGMQFSVKQRSPFKADFPTEKLKESEDLLFMANVWGHVLANRHKRASYTLNDKAHEMPKTFGSLVKGREKEFDELVTSIAFQYADCVEQDHSFLLKSLN